MYVLWGVHGIGFVGHTFMYSPVDKNKKQDSLVTEENDDDYLRQEDD